MKPRRKYITTGGAGYIPPVNIRVLKPNKHKIYNRIPANGADFLTADPFGVTNAVQAGLMYMLHDDDYVANRIKDSKYSLQNINKFPEDRRNLIKLIQNGYIGLEDAKSVYLGLPQRSGTLVPADKSPSMGTLTNAHKSTYLSTDPFIMENYLLPAYRNLYLGKTVDKRPKAGELSSIGKSGKNGVTILPILGNATVGYGNDNRGQYLSYYDKWDIALSGDSNSEDNFVSRLVGGRPFDLYDRIYLDDYYGVSEPTHSTYLPEVIIKPKK